MTVVIQGDAVKHVRTSKASLLAPFDFTGKPISGVTLGAAQFSWHPERAPSGPLTIVVSKSDQRIVVLRGGVEIGRSVARVNDSDQGSHVITLTRGQDGIPHWTYVGLPGHEAESGHKLDEAVVNRLQVPTAFYAAIKSELSVGATILITQSAVGTSTGEPLTILNAVVPRP